MLLASSRLPTHIPPFFSIVLFIIDPVSSPLFFQFSVMGAEVAPGIFGGWG